MVHVGGECGEVESAGGVERTCRRQGEVGHDMRSLSWPTAGGNSVLETVTTGVPMLTWPMMFEQFIIKRLITEVLGIEEHLWPKGADVRSTRY